MSTAPSIDSGVRSASDPQDKPTWVGDLSDLTRVRVGLMVLVATATGFWLGAEEATVPLHWRLLHTLVAMGLLAGGGGALNQVFERESDRRMVRTRNRPLPAGRMSVKLGWAIGTTLTVAGLSYLLIATTPLAAVLAAGTVFTYAFVYTPLKRATPLSTLVGAVPGAAPPLIGWSAATGHLHPVAWSLFGLLFFWQLPHFMAIAWLHRVDYGRSGTQLLTVRDPTGSTAARHAVSNSIALIFVSLIPGLFGYSGPLYLCVALGLGIGFLALSVWFAVTRTERAARALLRGSIVYLPAILSVLVFDALGIVS